MDNLKKEVKKLLSEQYGGKTALNDMFGQQIEKFVEEDLKEWLKLLAKQRTQLLARVREEVIGEFEGSADMEADMGLVADKLKREQLKKLEIISEEGK